MRARAALLVLLLASCWDVPEADWTPQSVVERLRILGVKAEPPEIEPGATTTLSALVVDAEGRSFTYAWLVCDPDPMAALGSACSRLDTARDAATLLRDPPPGVRIVPGLASIEYTAPPDTLERLPANSPERFLGVNATVALLVFTGTDPQAETAERQIAIKRIKVRAKDPYTNANPQIEEVYAQGQPVDEATPRSFAKGADVGLSATAVPGSMQKLLRFLPDGTKLEQDETLVFSWHVTQGRFESASERGDRTDAGEVIALRMPAESALVDVYLVLRDARGGIDWTRRTLVVP